VAIVCRSRQRVPAPIIVNQVSGKTSNIRKSGRAGKAEELENQKSRKNREPGKAEEQEKQER